MRISEIIWNVGVLAITIGTFMGMTHDIRPIDAIFVVFLLAIYVKIGEN